MEREVTEGLHETGGAPTAGRRGSVLLITLAMMGFLLLAMMGVSSQVQQHRRMAGRELERAIAREHAMLGLRIGLGTLQEHAGPDGRATARAEILGLGVLEEYARITGVWDGENPPIWLLSRPSDGGEPSDPAGISSPARPADFPAYVSWGDPGIRAYPVLLNGQSGEILGQVAFHVEDEGLKASLSRRDRYRDLSALTSWEKREHLRRRQLSPGGPLMDTLFPGLPEWEDQDLRASQEDERARAITLEQAIWIDGWESVEIDRMRHAVTWMSLGVLSDPLSGRLKRDLSSMAIYEQSSPPFEVSALRSILGRHLDDNDRIRMEGVDLSALAVGQPVHLTGPVLTEWACYGIFFRSGSNGQEMNLGFRLRADAWNPYSFPLGFSPPESDDFVMEVEGMPQFEVIWTKKPGTVEAETGSFSVDPSWLVWTDDRSNREFPWGRFHFSVREELSAGEVRSIRVWLRARVPEAFAGLAPGGNWRDVEFRVTAPAARLTVRILTLDGLHLQEFADIPFYPIDTAPFGPQPSLLYSNLTYQNHPFAFHFRFYDEVHRFESDQPSDMEQWLSVWDPRRPRFDLAEGMPERQMIEVSLDPAFAAIDGSLFSGRPEFFYGGGRTGAGQGGGNYHRFFDFPAVAPISVGWLQHLQFHGKRPFSIGNPWGGNLNEVFDRYYFSGVSSAPPVWYPHKPVDPVRPELGEYPLPNTRLRLWVGRQGEAGLASLHSEYSARHFLVEGAFNIHSTDAGAWAAHLGGLALDDWEYRVHEEWDPPIFRSRVRQLLPRFSMGADRHFEHPFHSRGRDDQGNLVGPYPSYPEISQDQKRHWYRNKWQPDWAAAFTVGMRELRRGGNPEGIDDLSDLAEAIVQALRKRGRPFASMNDFVNSGLLQQAIDQTRINTAGPANYVQADFGADDRFPRYAPAFLTQADILSALAPVLQVRSDTFVIRSYGDSTCPITGLPGVKIRLEARVQRVPDPFHFRDPGDPDLLLEDYIHPPGRMGRRFLVKNIRWLEGEDD